MTFTCEVSRASPIFWVQMSTTEVSGSELMNRAVVVGKKRAEVVDRVAARAAVKALAPNEDNMLEMIRRDKVRRRWDRIDEENLIETIYCITLCRYSH